MYVEEFLNIAKVANGFLIEVRRPYKDPTILNGTALVPMEKQETRIFVKDAEEVGTKVAELIPMLVEELSADEVFSNTFKEAEQDDRS